MFLPHHFSSFMFLSYLPKYFFFVVFFVQLMIFLFLIKSVFIHVDFFMSSFISVTRFVELFFFLKKVGVWLVNKNLAGVLFIYIYYNIFRVNLFHNTSSGTTHAVVVNFVFMLSAFILFFFRLIR